MRASTVTRSSRLDVTCREMRPKLRSEFFARLLSSRRDHEVVENATGSLLLRSKHLFEQTALLGVVTVVDRRRIQTTMCRDVSLREERTASRR